MKVCPKCNSTYSDETLNFCLTDGVPLVVEEALEEFLSSQNSWHTAETLRDGRFVAPVGEHTTSPNSSSPTLTLAKNETANFTGSKKKMAPATLYSIVGLILITFIGGFWWYSSNQNRSGNNLIPSPDNKSATPPRVIVQLNPQQEEQLKKEVTEFLEDWRATNERKDVDAHIAHYVNTLQIYYTESGVDRNIVRSDRLRAYQRYDSISMQLDKLIITPESTEAATVVFDKSWTMKNPKKTSTGSVQQEVHVIKQGGKWLIDSEKDLKVYFINNRENQTDENSNQINNSTDNSAANQK